MKTIHLSLVLPCYNEEPIFVESARTIYEALQRSRIPFEIIFVDDGSSDNTIPLITSFCHTHQGCGYILHRRNKGRGAAVTTGILAANGDIVGYMDIDCEVSPIYIASIVSLMDEKRKAMVIGKRIYRGGPPSWGRGFLSTGYRWLTTLVLGTNGIDTESGYKFFIRKKIVPILSFTQSNGWFWDTEIVIFAIQNHLSIEEFPVLFIRRTDKKSSVRIVRDTVDYIKNVIKMRQLLSSTLRPKWN